MVIFGFGMFVEVKDLEDKVSWFFSFVEFFVVYFSVRFSRFWYFCF